MKKNVILIIAALFTLISCGEVLPSSSTSYKVSSTSIVKTKNEVSDFILKGINQADALNMTYKVRNYVDDDIIEITFLYVCNNSVDVDSFEMSMMTFMKVNNDDEISIVKSYYKNREFYLSLFNASSGEFDLFRVNISEDMNMDELIDLTGMELFYSSPNDDLFSRIDEQVLTDADFNSSNEYVFNFNQNISNLKKISVDKDMSTIKIETDELDNNQNRIEQIVTLIPKFNDTYSIEFNIKKDNYTSITLEELGQLLTN